jgi:hypothetical protein
MLEIPNKLVRCFAIECLSIYIRDQESSLGIKLAKVVRARLFDLDSKCRVSAVKACNSLAMVMIKASNDEWLVGVFEDLVVLMVDEKTSVRKEALVCLQHMLTLLESHFMIGASSNLKHAAEMLSLVESRMRLKQQI